MAGGWCYVKEIVMPHYADFFVQSGLSVLIFDYRNLGGSDGQPRQHVDPYEQIEDYKNAISFAQTLPEIDPKRVGIWGPIAGAMFWQLGLQIHESSASSQLSP